VSSKKNGACSSPLGRCMPQGLEETRTVERRGEKRNQYSSATAAWFTAADPFGDDPSFRSGVSLRREQTGLAGLNAASFCRLFVVAEIAQIAVEMALEIGSG